MDKTNRYKKPNKRKAYRKARKLAAELSNALLWSPTAHFALPGPHDVVAKAIRVERGQRRAK